MSVSARVAVLPPGTRELRLESVVLPEPGPYEVIIEQQATGVCHSQLDLIDRGAPRAARDRPSRSEPWSASAAMSHTLRLATPL